MKPRLGIVSLLAVAAWAGLAVTARALPNVQGDVFYYYDGVGAVCGNEEPRAPDDEGDGSIENETYGDVACTLPDENDPASLAIAPGAIAACNALCAGMGYQCLYVYDRWEPFTTVTYCRCFDRPILGACDANGWAGATRYTSGRWQVP